MTKLCSTQYLFSTMLALLSTTQNQTHAQTTGQAAKTIPFNVSATAAVNGSSVLQCWQFVTPLTPSSQLPIPGLVSFPLGNLANGTYTIFPPRSDAGFHYAPYMQWVVALSGIAHVTLPNTTAGPTTEAWLPTGRYGMLFAADVKEVSQYGHGTAFPGDSDTVLLQIPVAGNTAPEHTVLYDGPCRYSELVNA